MQVISERSNTLNKHHESFTVLEVNFFPAHILNQVVLKIGWGRAAAVHFLFTVFHAFIELFTNTTAITTPYNGATVQNPIQGNCI